MIAYVLMLGMWVGGGIYLLVHGHYTAGGFCLLVASFSSYSHKDDK